MGNFHYDRMKTLDDFIKKAGFHLTKEVHSKNDMQDIAHRVYRSKYEAISSNSEVKVAYVDQGRVMYNQRDDTIGNSTVALTNLAKIHKLDNVADAIKRTDAEEIEVQKEYWRNKTINSIKSNNSILPKKFR